jgi:hypothetical protein
MAEDRDELALVTAYRKVVLAYEETNAEIDALIMAAAGGWDNMSEADRVLYRQLARQRDDLHNEMRVMEQQLLEGDED